MARAAVIAWSKITRNGQVTLPKEVRVKLGLRPGQDTVQILLTDREQVVIRKFVYSESVEL